MLFNEKLIRRRKERGLTQEELADHLSVSRQTVSKWENGDCMPDVDKFIRLSDLLEISLDELAGREVEVEPIVLPTPELPKSGNYERMVLVLSADGQERSALVVEGLVINADGVSWVNPD